MKWYLLLYCLCCSPALQAIELGLGLSAIEEGDDRIRPGVMAHIGIPDLGFVHIHHYGRKYGPIIERGYIATVNYSLDIFRIHGASFVSGALGVATLVENHRNRSAGRRCERNQRKSWCQYWCPRRCSLVAPYYFTGKLGVSDIPADEGIILLEHGRKQIISVMAGVSL